MNEKLPFEDVNGDEAAPIAVGEPVAHEATIARGQCAGVKRDGKSCHAKSVRGSKYCYFHDPASAQERIAASRRGGEKSRIAVLPPETPDFRLDSSADAAGLLARTINLVLRGEIDPKIANAVGYLVTIKLKATDADGLERRLAALEASLVNTNSDPAVEDD